MVEMKILLEMLKDQKRNGDRTRKQEQKEVGDFSKGDRQSGVDSRRGEGSHA